MGGGIDAIVTLMRKWIGEPGLLCNACLCIMSLVRGEGPACEVRTFKFSKAIHHLLLYNLGLASAVRRRRR